MLKRYTYPEMEKIWTQQNEFNIMLDIEIKACEAMAKAGKIPETALVEIKKKAGFEVKRVLEIEKKTRHDLLAFLQAVGEKVGDSAKYIHLGLTSSDIKDTALAIQMKQAASIIVEDLWALRRVLRAKAQEHKYTVMIGRTHGIHAEPMTLGMKFVLWLDETERNIARVQRAAEVVSVGKLSGAVGTYAGVEPEVEQYICEQLDLKPDRIATQIVQRDRHAEYMTALALLASSLEKFATEIRNLQRTDIREVEEFFHSGQKGSSAMPHKRNPITCERITGLARVVRSNSIAAMENIALWHERDISHSSVERIIVPDSTLMVDYMLRQFTEVVESLLVYPKSMQANIEKTGGLIYSQQVLLALVGKGANRETAYSWVQKHAMARWQEGDDFFAGLVNDENIKKLLNEEEIKACFDTQPFLRHVDTIMARFGI